jgi:hypothetical protein
VNRVLSASLLQNGNLADLQQIAVSSDEEADGTDDAEDADGKASHRRRERRRPVHSAVTADNTERPAGRFWSSDDRGRQTFPNWGISQ